MSYIIDALVLAIIALFILLGAKRGFVKGVLSVAATVLSFILSYTLSSFLANVFAPNNDDGVSAFLTYHGIKIILFIIMFIVLKIVLTLLSRILNLITRIPVINGANSLLGSVLGLINGVFTVSAIFFLVYLAVMIKDGLFGLSTDILQSTVTFKAYNLILNIF